MRAANSVPNGLRIRSKLRAGASYCEEVCQDMLHRYPYQCAPGCKDLGFCRDVCVEAFPGKDEYAEAARTHCLRTCF